MTHLSDRGQSGGGFEALGALVCGKEMRAVLRSLKLYQGATSEDGFATLQRGLIT